MLVKVYVLLLLLYELKKEVFVVDNLVFFKEREHIFLSDHQYILGDAHFVFGLFLVVACERYIYTI